MSTISRFPAPGAPGIEPRWTSSAKEGVGTAYSAGAALWFTLSHGIVNELYYPHVDTPNTRDLQFLITDGETFCHEEKRDLRHTLDYPEKNALLYRLTNTDPAGRYRLVKEVIVEPHSPVLLMRTRLEIEDAALRGKIRLHVLLAPHLGGTGWGNSAALHEAGGRGLVHAWRGDHHLVLGCSADFVRRSVGYAGRSDGWRELTTTFQPGPDYDSAPDGNLALRGEIDLSGGLEFTVAVAFGSNLAAASTAFLQALATPFGQQREKFVAQWRRAKTADDGGQYPEAIASMLRLSHRVLLAHEDKIFPGGFVASLSIPWGETKDDCDRGGYHLVWTRDLLHTATALLACGETEGPLRALIWLAAVQDPDGGLPQNSSITGEPYWRGIQLDEVAAPVLLAWRLREEDALRQFDPWTIVARAARFLVHRGPVTGQDRWEECAGYSPSTLAAMIAALVCAAEFARARTNDAAATFLLDYADWLAGHVEDWTATTRGTLVPGTPRHYIRITPADPANPRGVAAPDTAAIALANGGGTHPARDIVSGDFLQLVRLGVRHARDPLVVDSVRVVDALLKRTVPQGPCWRRYNFDGYGQKQDGQAYDGVGRGGSWPLLTGERGLYELALGRDPMPLLEALAAFGNSGGMLPEQVWDEDDLEDGAQKRGQPTGSAMPLCWAHAELLTLARSRLDGAPYDRPKPVYERYALGRAASRVEMWTFQHQLPAVPSGKTLRIIAAAPGMLHWSMDDWRTTHDSTMNDSGLGCWWADLPTAGLPAGARAVFTFRWKARWEGIDFEVAVVPADRRDPGKPQP